MLSWRVSVTMEAAFCIEALEDAVARRGKSEIFNTDQGSQFTGAAFTGVLDQKRDRHQHGRQGRLAGQRLCRAAVAQCQIRGGVSQAYDTASEARASIGRYLDFYNRRRPHSSPDDSTSDHAYFTSLPLRVAA